MENFGIGDLVVLTAGSMRMAVEAVEDERVHCVWVHEGKVGRDSFHPLLLKRWEVRETGEARGREEGAPRRRDEAGPPRRRDEEGGFRGGREQDAGRRGPKPFAKPFGGPASPAPHKPRPKPTGWDGKPREKKFFRKD